MVKKTSSLPPYWDNSAADLLTKLGSSPQGLTTAEAARRLSAAPDGGLQHDRGNSDLVLLWGQFRSPIILILIFAAGLSFALKDHANALIILTIVVISGSLGFWQERGAAGAVAKLLTLVQIKASVLRDGQQQEVATHDVVVGDIILIAAGDKIPGDCLLLESKELYVNEAALTGETYPVEKSVGMLPGDAPLNARTNSLFLGTNVTSGSATAVVARIGAATEFGQVSAHLMAPPPETDFESGIRHFGYLLAEVTLLLVLGIFAINVFLHKPVLDSFLFALALAVGLTPQLLPAIISINLAHGAKRMAQHKVIVKRLAAIENFGSMNVLCSDKTGTLTEGEVQVQGAFDSRGQSSDDVFLHAFLNASFESGFNSPIDRAIRTARQLDIGAYRKINEIPYDFTRKRLSVILEKGPDRILISKGALANILHVCTSVAVVGQVVALDTERATIEKQFEAYSAQGLRTLGIAAVTVPAGQSCGSNAAQEAGMTFLGFLTLADPPKSGIVNTIKELYSLGVAVKMITGDNRLVAAHVGAQVGLEPDRLLAGPELAQMSNEALLQRVGGLQIFAEIEPNQKERIILALRQAGNVVGYMGDGINDASALHAADVGISVASAVDVAREAAEIVLLEQDLAVLVQGVREGRTTFANTLKYVFMATSANFGNMFSMAGASLFLPFLPLLPKQILLTNLLTDFPEMTIATDEVDAEMVNQPRRWDIAFIQRFMLTFGLLSSVFDYLTFGVLKLLMHAGPAEFRTGWFIESVISASFIVLVIRTRRPFYRSRPGRSLVIATLAVALGTLVLPFTPLGVLFGFCAVPPLFLLAMLLVMGLYIAAAEVTKQLFYARESKRPSVPVATPLKI